MASLQPTPVQGTGSTGISYQKLLDSDTRPVPDVLRLESAREFPPAVVPIERYVSQEFHDLEIEKVWGKVWQMACREEDIPEVGDHILYEIGDHSLIVIRSSEHEIRALHNSCLHRGRALRDGDGRAAELRFLPKTTVAVRALLASLAHTAHDSKRKRARKTLAVIWIKGGV